jgi:hypothetical protein
MMCCAGAVRGQEITPKTDLLNFGSLFSSMRAGYALNQHLEKSDIFYTPIKSFTNSAGLELANINIGYNGAKKRPLLALGLRMDNIDALLWSGAWGKVHVRTAKLPTLEFGPFLSLWPIKVQDGYKIELSYGVAADVGFGK